MATVLPAPKAPVASARVLDTSGLVRHELRLQGGGSIRADILPESIQEQPDGSLLLKLRLATAYPVRRFGYFDGGYEEFEEVLSFEPGAHRDERLNSGRTPLLENHDQWSLDSVLGVLFDPVWDRAVGTLDLSCRISGRDALAGLRQDVKGRIVTNTSAGYRVYQYRDVTQKGDARRRLLAIDWETREGSLVPLGADPTSHTRGERPPAAAEPTARKSVV